MIKFEIGKSYSCRSACDSNCVWTYTVVARTNKTIKLAKKLNEFDTVVTKYVAKEYDGMEILYPNGKYSMCPVLRSSQ